MDDKLAELLHGAGLDDIVIPKKDFIKEHKHLVSLLNRYDVPAFKQEAADQSAELKRMTGGFGKSSGFIRRMMAENALKHKGSYGNPTSPLHPHSTMKSAVAFDVKKLANRGQKGTSSSDYGASPFILSHFGLARGVEPYERRYAATPPTEPYNRKDKPKRAPKESEAQREARKEWQPAPVETKAPVVVNKDKVKDRKEKERERGAVRREKKREEDKKFYAEQAEEQRRYVAEAEERRRIRGKGNASSKTETPEAKAAREAREAAEKAAEREAKEEAREARASAAAERAEAKAVAKAAKAAAKAEKRAAKERKREWDLIVKDADSILKYTDTEQWRRDVDEMVELNYTEEQVKDQLISSLGLSEDDFLAAMGYLRVLDDIEDHNEAVRAAIKRAEERAAAPPLPRGVLIYNPDGTPIYGEQVGGPPRREEEVTHPMGGLPRPPPPPPPPNDAPVMIENPMRIGRMRGRGGIPDKNTLQQLAKQSYSSQRTNVGSLKLFFSTPTLAFYKENNTIVVAIRGTADATDVKADAMIPFNSLNNSQRFKNDLDTLQNIQKQFPPSQFDYYGVGHSLGGAILDIFLKMRMLKSGVSYNPAVQPMDLSSKIPNERIYFDGDPMLLLFGNRLSVKPEIRKKTTPFLSATMGLTSPLISTVADTYDAHRLDNFSGGRVKM